MGIRKQSIQKRLTVTHTLRATVEIRMLACAIRESATPEARSGAFKKSMDGFCRSKSNRDVRGKDKNPSIQSRSTRHVLFSSKTPPSTIHLVDRLVAINGANTRTRRDSCKGHQSMSIAYDNFNS